MRARSTSGVPPADPAVLPGEDIARALELFASQVAVSALESEEPVAALAHFMLSMSASTEEILAAVRAARGGASDPARAAIERQCALMLERVRLAVIAFQFHDLLNQRLNHVRTGLVDLAGMLRDPHQRTNPEYWRAVAQRIRERYRLDQQHELFDDVVNGVTADDAAGPDAGAGHRRRVELF